MGSIPKSRRAAASGRTPGHAQRAISMTYWETGSRRHWSAPRSRFRWSGLSVGDIFATIRTTMPQGAPASLSRQAYADLAAFLLSVNDYPAGDEELEPDVATLEPIRIESQRP